MSYIFQCNWPPVSVEMTIPETQQLCAEIQVGMTQEAEKQPEEMGWCLTKTIFVNIPWNLKFYANHHRLLSYITYHQSHQVLHSHCNIHTLTKWKAKWKKITGEESVVALRLSITKGQGSLTEKERSDLWKMGSIHWETENVLITNLANRHFFLKDNLSAWVLYLLHNGNHDLNDNHLRAENYTINQPQC